MARTRGLRSGGRGDDGHVDGCVRRNGAMGKHRDAPSSIRGGPNEAGDPQAGTRGRRLMMVQRGQRRRKVRGVGQHAGGRGAGRVARDGGVDVAHGERPVELHGRRRQGGALSLTQRRWRGGILSWDEAMFKATTLAGGARLRQRTNLWNTQNGRGRRRVGRHRGHCDGSREGDVRAAAEVTGCVVELHGGQRPRATGSDAPRGRRGVAAARRRGTIVVIERNSPLVVIRPAHRSRRRGVCVEEGGTDGTTAAAASKNCR